MQQFAVVRVYHAAGQSQGKLLHQCAVWHHSGIQARLFVFSVSNQQAQEQHVLHEEVDPGLATVASTHIGPLHAVPATPGAQISCAQATLTALIHLLHCSDRADICVYDV